jgi:hypothetical protein
MEKEKNQKYKGNGCKTGHHDRHTRDSEENEIPLRPQTQVVREGTPRRAIQLLTI